MFKFRPDCLFDLLNSESGRKGALELSSLLGISDLEGVQVFAASHLELGGASLLGSLDSNDLSILSSGGEEEVLDLFDFLRLASVRSMLIIHEDCRLRESCFPASSTNGLTRMKHGFLMIEDGYHCVGR
eukprot:TRINITY_DN255_c0_g1_i1.p1 TRINITY_DN255_c0_g1~~TRINITY_DN255_c0_g1_i1.p1  ORF type:complete len:129 (-),score=1.54 TRINITY_DN255_c0_g1_i1:40-426(-)